MLVLWLIVRWEKGSGHPRRSARGPKHLKDWRGLQRSGWNTFGIMLAQGVLRDDTLIGINTVK